MTLTPESSLIWLRITTDPDGVVGVRTHRTQAAADAEARELANTAIGIDNCEQLIIEDGVAYRPDEDHNDDMVVWTVLAVKLP